MASLILKITILLIVYFLFTLYKYELASIVMETIGFGNGRYYMSKPGHSSAMMNAGLLLGTDIPIKPMKYFRPAREKKTNFSKSALRGSKPKRL